LPFATDQVYAIRARCLTGAIKMTDARGRMNDDTVASDEARRVAWHEAIKSHVGHDVKTDIEERVGHADAAVSRSTASCG
jgi:hypothetical protein